MNKRAIILIAFLLSSCGDTSKSEVASAESCIPPEYRVASVPWIPPSPDLDLTDSGVAFFGCWLNESIRNCIIPKSVVSGGISWDAMPERTFGKMPVDAFYRQLPQDPSSTITYDRQYGVIVVVNPNLTDRWLIWEPKSRGGSAKVDQLDTLSAVCGYDDVMRNGVYEKEIFCQRFVSGKNYYVDIEFWSPTRIPSDLPLLDRELMSALETWDCKKPPSGHK